MQCICNVIIIATVDLYLQWMNIKANEVFKVTFEEYAYSKL
jgi:hypothetical protein